MELVNHIMKKKNFDRLTDKHPIIKRKDLHLRYIPGGEKEIDLNQECRLIEIDGKRTVRHQWENEIFKRGSSVSAVCCVISLSLFDEIIIDENNRELNRMNESLSFCLSVLRRSERHLEIFFVFTKLDILKRKVRNGINLSDYFQDYKGDNRDFNSVRDFIIEKFFELDKAERVKKHYILPSSFDKKAVKSSIREMFTECGATSWQQEQLEETEFKILDSGRNRRAARKLTPFSLLQGEIIHFIMEFFTTDELINTLMFVSTEWCEIAYKIPIDLTRPDFDLFMKTKFQHVKSLNLQSRFVSSKQLREISENPKFKNLQYLNLSNNYNFTLQDFEYLFENHEFRDLKDLILAHCNLDLSIFKIICRNRNLQLKNLSIQGNIRMGNECIEFLKESSFANTLKSFQYTNTHIKNEALKGFEFYTTREKPKETLYESTKPHFLSMHHRLFEDTFSVF